MRYPRSFHKLYANVMGYFWLPCPLCGVEFGGHEWNTDGENWEWHTIPTDDPTMREGICPACAEKRRLAT